MSEETPDRTVPASMQVVRGFENQHAMVIPIDGPVALRFEEDRVEIAVIIAVAGQADGVRVLLRLSPTSSGHLVGGIKQVLDEGLVILDGDQIPLQ